MTENNIISCCKSYFAQARSAWAFLHFKVIRAILGSIEFRYAFRIFKKGECNYNIH